MSPDQLAQLGIAGIFALACVQLFKYLMESLNNQIKYLSDQNSELRKANRALEEQNKLLSIALFSNNPDAMRVYGALSKSIPSTQTDLGEKP